MDKEEYARRHRVGQQRYLARKAHGKALLRLSVRPSEVPEAELEKRRTQARLATRRYRARIASGASDKRRPIVPAPNGVAFQEIPGYSDYRADKFGNLYTRLPDRPPRFEDGPYVPWRVLPVYPNQDGRLTVRVRADGAKKRKRMMVHRLVALAFFGPRPKGMWVAHGPNGYLDNSVGNLSYKTPAQNKADELRDGTRVSGDRHHASKISNLQLLELLRRVAGGERKTDLCREFGIHPASLHHRLRRLKIDNYDCAGIFDGVLHGGGSGIRRPCVT